MFLTLFMILWTFLSVAEATFLSPHYGMATQPSNLRPTKFFGPGSSRVTIATKSPPWTHSPQLHPLTQLNFFWFGNSNDEKKKKSSDDKNKKKPSDKAKGSGGGGSSSGNPPSSNMGTTATTMENFKQSQELGRKTSALLAELSSTTVEGAAAGGKIKVLVDGQQKPMGVEIDDDYFETVTVEDLTEKLATAMQDAHEKSTKLMQDRMESLYADIGLPMNK